MLLMNIYLVQKRSKDYAKAEMRMIIWNRSRILASL